MTTINHTREERIDVAKRFTAKTAELKDWRLRNKHNRAMREIARELTVAEGYIECSVIELADKYGHLCHHELTAPGADEKQIWGLCWNQLWKRILFTAI